jgi:hypothetical protein
LGLLELAVLEDADRRRLVVVKDEAEGDEGLRVGLPFEVLVVVEKDGAADTDGLRLDVDFVTGRTDPEAGETALDLEDDAGSRAVAVDKAEATELVREMVEARLETLADSLLSLRFEPVRATVLLRTIERSEDVDEAASSDERALEEGERDALERRGLGRNAGELSGGARRSGTGWSISVRERTIR